MALGDVVDYEVFTLNYDLLVGFGKNSSPSPVSRSRGPRRQTA